MAGGIYDEAVSLVKFEARWNDPSNGRWTTKDPIRFEGGDTSLYGYSANDPINLVDPEGLSYLNYLNFKADLMDYEYKNGKLYNSTEILNKVYTNEVIFKDDVFEEKGRDRCPKNNIQR